MKQEKRWGRKKGQFAFAWGGQTSNRHSCTPALCHNSTAPVTKYCTHLSGGDFWNGNRLLVELWEVQKKSKSNRHQWLPKRVHLKKENCQKVLQCKEKTCINYRRRSCKRQAACTGEAWTLEEEEAENTSNLTIIPCVLCECYLPWNGGTCNLGSLTITCRE